MKCEHCGYDAPERAVICPECGEILPRPKKAEEEETEKAAVQKKTAPDADSFSMPFLSAPADLEKADGIAAEDPEVLRRQKQEKTPRLTRRIVAAAVAAAVVLAAVLYYVFFGGYKLAVYRYVKGVDRESGSMYVALVPDAYMDYLETTYSTTRREVKSMMQDYFKYWNKNYGTDGRMSYDIGKTEEITDADEISALESELKTDYNITVEIKKAVTVSVNIDDGGTKASEQATFVKIGNRWCCMKAMEDIDFVCQNDGYNVW